MRDYVTLLVETGHGVLDRKTFSCLTDCVVYARNFVSTQAWIEQKVGSVITVERLETVIAKLTTTHVRRWNDKP